MSGDLFTPPLITGAVISDCKKYRYQLWRIWDDSKEKVLFIMHNPSTADAVNPDPTVTRCINFAKAWGYGGIYIGNLIPYRCTNPADLKVLSFDELYGDDPFVRLEYTNEMVAKCSMHVLAYGNPVIKDCIPEMFDDHWHYLQLTKAGNPGHPLYLKGDLIPQKLNK